MRIGRRAFISLLLAGSTLPALSCGGQTDLPPNGNTSTPASSLFTGNKIRSMKRPEVSYLDRVIPPCTVQFGDQDPCSDRSLVEPEMRSVNAAPPIWPFSNEIPTFEQLLIREGYDVVYTPHIVVRGVVIPDTTRCAPYSDIPAKYKRDEDSGLYFYLCFVDLATSEYMVGSGPRILTVSMLRENLHGVDDLTNWENLKEETTQRLYDPRYRTAIAYEGRELVLFLDLPITIAVEAWDTEGLFIVWSVQRNESNEIRAVAAEIRNARTDEQRARLDIPLDELTQKVKEASAKRMIITEGRIGIDKGLPMLVTDANYLQDFYISEGAVYDDSESSTLLPPQIPGEGCIAACFLRNLDEDA